MFSSPVTPKYRHLETDEQGRPLYWHTSMDGYPSLEQPEQQLTDKEKALTELQYAPGYAYFELPRDKGEYLKLIDKIANGLYWMLNKKTETDKNDPAKMHCHIEWVVPTSTYVKQYIK